ncbi:MAG TPA: hypothetical protein VF529_22445 [Solirubrobacteraceae bacterium]
MNADPTDVVGRRVGAALVDFVVLCVLFVVRTLLRMLDGLFFYAVALAVVLATGQRRQRIGDLAAGTVVVRV